MSLIFINLIILAILPYTLQQINHPKSCLEVKELYGAHRNGFYTIQDDTNSPYPTVCDFNSDPGFAWTLVESLSLRSAQMSKFRKSFYTSVANDKNKRTWSSYRLSKFEMKAIHRSPGSTHFRAACYPNAASLTKSHDHRDYLRVAFCAYPFFFSFRTGWDCVKVDFINVRGFTCRGCRLPLDSTDGGHLHINLSRAEKYCDKIVFPKNKENEQVFGQYQIFDESFSCTAKQDSVTTWWIGGTMF